MSYGGDFGNFNQRSFGPRRSRSKLFLILFAVTLFLILIIFFVAFSFNTNNVSQRDLYKGGTFELKDNESLKMKFQKEKHEIDVRILGASSVEVTVASEPITKRIKINESAFFDLTNDSKNDLRVWLLGIENYEAILEFKRIDGFYCTPDWDCGKWGDCTDGLRRRECNDLNRCGKPEETPDLERFCASVLEGDVSENETEVDKLISGNVSENINQSPNESLSNDTGLIYENGIFIGNGELTCLDNYGSICTGGQKCNGNWINSSDSLRCCFGVCYSPVFNLNGTNNSVACDKTLSSFRLAVSNCTAFEMNCIENVLVFELGIIQGFESVFEIQGYSGINCVFHYSYGNVFINYTSEKFSNLIEQGKSIPEINFQLDILEEEHVSKYQEKSMTCLYPKNEFLTFARAWEEGDTEWSRDILGKYNCEGSLAGL